MAFKAPTALFTELRTMTNPRPPPRPDPPTPKARAKQKRNRQSPPPPSPKRRPPLRKPPPRTKPSSPTTSSRSKKSTPSNVLTATSPRRPVRRRTLLTLDSIPIPPPHNVLFSTRLFGSEIQNLMHAFGEVRYCARPVLELVEDAVRACVLRVARGAYENNDLTVAGVARALGGDLHSVARFNQATKDVRKEKVPYQPAAWELLTDISEVFPGEERPPDLHFQATWRAPHAFRNAMGLQLFQELYHCRGTKFVKGESRSRAPKIRGMSRLVLFRQWLSLPSSWNVGDDVFHALGHIAWECVGIITQTALMVRYWDDFAAGVGDPRRMNWTYGRHVIAALAYGLSTAVMIPLTDLQAASLKQEMDTYYTVSQTGANRWRGYTNASSPCLLPHHIREALRRLERRSDSVFGYSGSPLLAYGIDF